MAGETFTELRQYRTVKKNGKSEHAEEQFIKDFKEDKFHKDSNFELYL